MLQYKPHILISGGGTGGHIFPAIAIANALKEQLEGPEMLFIGAKGRMEMEKVPQAGYTIKGIWISGFQRKLSLRNLFFPIKVVSSLCSVNRILKEFKPDVAIGTGGYASGPAIRMAARKGIPTLILEQNSFPGVTNKLLANHVDRICVAHQGMERYFPATKLLVTGNPVRKDILDISEKREHALDFFKLAKDRPTLLVIGGSQGALSINKALIAQLPALLEKQIQVLWQTGRAFYGEAHEMAVKLNTNSLQVLAFIERMDLAYAASDVVLSRAGAIAISELCITGKPAILVPLPHAAEDHQTRNAQALVEQSAALMLKDDLLGKDLSRTIDNLIFDQTRMKELSRNISQLGKPDAAAEIASEAIRLMKIKKSIP